MAVTYRFRCDSEYIKTTFHRHDRQLSSLRRPLVYSGVIGLICAAALYMWIDGPWQGRAIFAVIAFSFMLAYGMATQWVIRAKFKRAHRIGNEVMISLSDDWVEMEGKLAQAKVAWLFYPTAVRYDDGILLQRRRSARWLPDAGIAAGSATEATALVASKTRLRHIQ